nr:hypothetical protein [Solirubrobacterales bacterium]
MGPFRLVALLAGLLVCLGGTATAQSTDASGPPAAAADDGDSARSEAGDDLLDDGGLEDACAQTGSTRAAPVADVDPDELAEEQDSDLEDAANEAAHAEADRQDAVAEAEQA